MRPAPAPSLPPPVIGGTISAYYRISGVIDNFNYVNMPNLIDIVFDKELATYHPGETVSGKVLVNLKDELHVKGVFLIYQGIASVSWVDGYGDDRVTRKDSETYFKHSNPIQNDFRLGPGIVEYPFLLNLPSNLPSSFEGRYGNIRYECHFKISRHHLPTIKYKARFTVINNETSCFFESRMLSRYTMEDSKDVATLFCKLGVVSAVMSTDKLYFCPGDTIILYVELFNSTSTRIARTSTSLLCNITYTAGDFTVVEKSALAKIRHGKILPGHSSQWIDQIHIDPSVPMKDTGEPCRLFKVEYVLKVSVHPQGICTTNLNFIVPITICSTPSINFETTCLPIFRPQRH